jgi:hypothetical protein
MDAREELRRLIDVIEQGSNSVSVEQAVEDIKAFTNTASFLANRLEARLMRGEAKPKASHRALPKPPRMPVSKPVQSNSQKPQRSPTPTTVNSVVTQADYDRLKAIAPQRPMSAD